MAKTTARPGGSTARTRERVLTALGVVRIATAAQIRQITCPGTASPTTVRGGCQDLARARLVRAVGTAQRPGQDGQAVTEKLWVLTPSGVRAAAALLRRPPREVTAPALTAAAQAGAAGHALDVTDTVASLLQIQPEPTRPVPRTDHPPRPRRPAPARPRGLGTLASVRTHVALPTTGSWTSPGRGSLVADVLVPVPVPGEQLFVVLVDDGSDDSALAARIAAYAAFCRRTVRDPGSIGEFPMWFDLTPQAPRVWHRSYPPPPLAVITTAAHDAAGRTRLAGLEEATSACWGSRPLGRLAVVYAALHPIARYGPHAPAWHRFGHSGLHTLDAALNLRS